MKHQVLLVGMLLALLGFAALPALAEDVQQATVLTANTVIGGALAASEGAGTFSYYRLAYPGDGVDLRIQVRFSPGDPTIAPAVGFNVYAPNNRVERGSWKADEGCLEVTYQEDAPAILLVQVYNYSGSPVTYALTIKGLPETPTPAAPAQAVAAAAVTKAAPSAQAGKMTGMVVGNTGGAFAGYSFSYAGDESAVTFTMTYAPADPSFTGALGFHIYDPSGNLVASGAPRADAPNVMEATLVSDVAGNYWVQIFNYTDGVALYYALEIAS